MKPGNWIAIGCLAVFALLGTASRDPAWAGAQPPPPPDAVRATAIDGAVVFTWDGFGHTADSFNIYWTTETNNFNPRTWGNTISIPWSDPALYIVTNLTNNQTYSFAIVGVNAAGERNFSNYASASPNTNPRPAPTAFTGASGNQQVKLFWVGTPGATGYRIYWSNTPGVTPGNGTAIDVAAQPGPGQSYTLSGLTNYQHYYFIVVALNGATPSTPAGQICSTPNSSFAPPPPPPPPPTCGNGTCGGGENCATCPSDCGVCPPPPPPPPPTCGNGTCGSGEDCLTCSSDCGVCPPPPPPPPTCGNGTCNSGEDCAICSSDCGVCPPPPGVVGPDLSGLAPAAATVGDQSLTLRLMGSGFQPGAQWVLAGQTLAAQFISAQELTGAISANLLAAEGTLSVSVRNPDGGVSASQSFTVAPQPVMEGFANLRSVMRDDEVIQVRSSGIAKFTWTLTPLQGTPNGGSPVSSHAPAHAPNFNTSTLTNQVPIAQFQVPPGGYTISVVGKNIAGKQSAAAQANVIITASALDAARVYPNPWRSDTADEPTIKFDQLPADAHVKIFTISGHWIRTVDVDVNRATWDLKDDSGNTVSSGLYLYVINDSTGNKKRGKLAVIK